MTFKELYRERSKQIKEKLENIKKLGGEIKQLEKRYNNIIENIELKEREENELKETIYADLLHLLNNIQIEIVKFENEYQKLTAIKTKINLINIDKILEVKDLDEVISFIEKILIEIKNESKFPIFIKEIEEKLSEIIYKIIKKELSNRLKSRMLELIIRHKYENKLRPLILKDIETHLKNQDISSEEYKNLYLLYDQYSNFDNRTLKETILFIAYIEDRNKIKTLITNHYYELYSDITKNREFLDRHIPGLEEDVSYYGEIIKEKEKKQHSTNLKITGRITAFALSLTLLIGSGVIIHKFIKDASTVITYPTTKETITLVGNKMIYNEPREVHPYQKLDDLCIIRDFSNIFYDETGKFRFEQKYSFDDIYIKGTPLENYMNLSGKDLKPLENGGKYYGLLTLEKDDVPLRDVTVYTQDIDSPNIDTDKAVVKFLDIVMCVIFSGPAFLLPYMPLDNIKKIIDLISKKNKNKKECEEILGYLIELNNELEAANVNIESFKESYNQLLEVATTIGINIPEYINTQLEKNYEQTLKLNKIKRDITTI